MAAGDEARAFTDFQRYLQRRPRSLQARYLAGLSAFLLGNDAAALSLLQPLWPSQQRNLACLYVLSLAAGGAHDASWARRAAAALARVGAHTASLRSSPAR